MSFPFSPFGYMDTAFALVTIGNVPVHPGAARYYQEIGVPVSNIAQI